MKCKKSVFLFFGFLFFARVTVCMDLPAAEERARKLLAAMTPEERFDLVCGDGIMGISGIDRLNIPPVFFADASAGINTHNKAVAKRHGQTVAYPCTLLLTAAWNPQVAESYARSIGEECRAGGTHILLGPGMNLYRISACGRNWEYTGEDPHLAARIVEAYVHGMQSTGTGATLKHFIGNETEFRRRGSNSIIGERALHEIYMVPFQAGINAGALAVMTAYNQLNDEWCAQNSYILSLLRKELHFPGLIMADWDSTFDGMKFAENGGDLETPGGWALRQVRKQVLGSDAIDLKVRQILKTCIAAGYYNSDYAKPEWEANRPQWEQAALKANQEGIVLLKNTGILPLKKSSKTVLVAGNNALRKTLSGGGSGHVPGYNLKTYLEACKETFKNVVYAEAPTDEQIESAGLVLLFPGFPQKGKSQECENANRPFVLPDESLLVRIVSQNPNAVICLTAGGGVRMDWADNAAAIVHAFYGGQTGPDALMDILTGKVNPSGKLPFTIEQKLDTSPGFNALRPVPNLKRPYAAQEFPKRLAGQFFSNRNKTENYLYDVDYSEGVFVGYRGYDEKKTDVRFPFGHGLSYTTFDYKKLHVEKIGDQNVRVLFVLENAGSRAGAEVAQLYIGDLKSSAPRPPRELKAFRKIFLAPGESQTITIDLGPEAFRFWHPETRKWIVEPGKFRIEIGASSRDLRLHEKIKL